MRSSLLLLAVLCLAGCPAGKPVEQETQPPPFPATTPPPTPTPTPTPVVPEMASFEGVWATVDKDGDPFDLVIFPNGQAVTNWTKGPPGAEGERGVWRREGNRLLVFYTDGWTDVLESVDGQIRHRGYAPGVSLEGPPTNEAPAGRIEGPAGKVVGVWRLNREPDGSYLYLALLSSGRAVSTVNGGTEGTWKPEGKGVRCQWQDGWIDLLEKGDSGWTRRSWIGEETGEAADVSAAVRVGEDRFAITP